jgi:hypothetical protein
MQGAIGAMGELEMSDAAVFIKHGVFLVRYTTLGSLEKLTPMVAERAPRTTLQAKHHHWQKRDNLARSDTRHHYRGQS